MLVPLEQWSCDMCGDLITAPEDGCIVWCTRDGRRLSTKFLIMHSGRQCWYDRSCLPVDGRFAFAMPLSEARTKDGLATLLKRLDSLVARRQPEESHSLVEVILRVTVPYYEEARFFWDLAAAEGVHDGTRFDEATLVQIIRWKDDAVTAGIKALTEGGLSPPASAAARQQGC